MSSVQKPNHMHSFQESVDKTYSFPTSFAQQRLWFLDRLLGASGAFNINWAVMLEGTLDFNALRQSFNEIVARHEVLRTCFTYRNGEPVQVILPPFTLECPVIELSSSSEIEREQEARQIIDAECDKTFDLEMVPLLRTSLFKITEHKHILLVSMHHIVSDGWSVNVFEQELESLYRAFSQNLSSPLPDLPIQYKDYAIRQRSLQNDAVLEQQLSYWKRQLKDLTVLELPTDRPRPVKQSSRGAREHIQLSKELTEGIKSLSRREGVTLFMTLLAVFQVLLYRYSGQDDIAVGTAISGRKQQDIENLIGIFVNTLVLRSDLSGNPKFNGLLKRVHKICVDAYRTPVHREMPFDKLVAGLKPQKDLSRHPLFQVALVLWPTSLKKMELPGLSIEEITIDNKTSQLDLRLSLKETRNGLVGYFEYSTDLFNSETITRMAGHFQTLLKAVIEHPESTIAELPLLTAPERHQLLIEWNATQADYPKDKCIHQLFEEQVARTPDAVALVFEQHELSYQALNTKANQMAHYLRKLGVGPDTLVGICVERGLDMIIGLLGILKAGGAFVPLDPAYPKERLAFMLEDSAPIALLTESGTAEVLAGAPNNIPKVNFAADKALWEGLSDANPNRQTIGLAPEHMAYVIYTSGSTGQPKGVMIEHRGLCNLVAAQTQSFMIQPESRILQFASFSFDACVAEIVMSLCQGASLYLPSRGIVLAGEPLLQILEKNSITHVTLPPTVLAALPEQAEMDSVKTLIVAGEASSNELPKRWARGRRFINAYGPTETTVWATQYVCTPEEPRNPPIGRPIANTQIYILDLHGEPVPVGVTGEIHIGSAGLARGYLNRPELTVEKFIRHPFSDDLHARLYKTGDLARYLPDGTIEFLGRIDHQVKLRGFRIELGEIESVLGQHPFVNQVFITVREDQPGDKRLVAYFTSSQEELSNVNALRQFLKEKLPEYMVPAAFVVLNQFPLTPNGKIDRKALPAPNQTRTELLQSYVPPRSPIEEMLVAIWQEILKVNQIGIHDNFFELGGHSLLAVQLIVRINKQFQIEFPLHLLFEEPTVAGLSWILEKTLEQAPAANIEPIHTITRALPVPTSFAQQRLWFLDRLLGASSLYNISWGIQINGNLNVSALQQSLHEIVVRHEVLRTCFIEQDGEPVQVIRTSVPFECALMDLSALSQENRGSKIQALIDAEANKPFDLKQAPLMRALLLKLAEQEHILLIVIHHIVSDGWSMGVLLQELTSFYNAFSQGQSANLPELPIQYADYAVWQRDWLQGEVLERQLGYWKTQLADLTILELPTDKPRPKQQSYRGARAAVQLPAALTQGLKTLSQQQNVSLFMTLLAALQVLLHRYSGQDDIVVGTAIAGRNRPEVENLIGFFVNTLALRTDLSGTPGLRQLLSRVSEVCLSAYAHQDVPFEKLVAELNPQRDMSRNPFFDVLVNQFNKPIKPLDLKDLDTHSIEQADILAKFSLTLYISVNDETIDLEVVYQDELFSAGRIASLLEQYQYLLEQIITSPDTVISKYSLVTANSRPLLPDPAIAILDAPQLLVQDSFLKWASQAPDNIAVSLNDQRWTYRDLADSGIKLAHEFKNIGLEKGQVVGITGAPSFGLIATIIGVFLSGGVILTIDEQLPVKRKQSMLSASSAKILCLIDDNANLLNDRDDLQGFIILNVNPQTASLKNAGISSGHDNTELPAIKGDDNAYIFFTSGSTGVPKGVLGRHKGLSHFINWQREHFKVDQKDRVAQLTNLSFDVFLRDLFLPLTSGATLCLPGRRDILDTVSWLGNEHISIVHTVPSIFRTWLDRQSDTIKPHNLRYLFLAGEPLTDDLVNNWRQTFPDCGQIINLYGPTETTLAKLFYVVPDSASNGIQPIGQSLPQTQALILNKSDVLCGVGEIGQIVIRTPFRSLGYINLPEQTRHAFRRNPFSTDEQDIVYYTGDLGRYRSDGLMEILGRVDNQVKIRGVRIEPEEITAILDKHEAVSSSVVIAVKGAERNYLLGYVVPEKNATVTISDIRNFLSGQLPPVMIPEQFVFLDKMPLKANGKIDRGALPAPDQIHSKSEQPYVPPRSPIEEMLVAIWQEVLKVDQIGIHDNFFESGGHSLLAVQLIVRINKQFQTEFPLHLLFEEPTVAGLSRLLATSLEQAPAANTEHIHTITRDLPIPASFAQQRLWFLDQLLGASSLYNIAWGFQLIGKLNATALEQSIGGIVARHEVLRTCFIEQDSEPVQVIRASVPFECTLMDLSALPQKNRDSDTQRILDDEANKAFDLKQAPLMRALLLKLSEQEHILLIVIHHIISDGWSRGVLLQELASHYCAFCQSRSPTLPELPIQYADYSVWQRDWLQGDVLERQLGYWKTQLDGLTILELPTDKPRPKQQSYRGARTAIQLPAALTKDLKTLSQQQNVTLFMTLLAALQVLLHRYSGQDDIVVGTAIAGRNRQEIENLIGLFVNTLALRTDLSGTPSFRQLLSRVREVCLSAYAHQDLPFEKLVADLQVERDMSRHPLFQVMLVLQPAVYQDMQIPSLSINTLTMTNETAKFDLSFSFVELADGLTGTIEYNTDLFNTETISRLAGHFQTLLAAIVECPETTIAELPLLTAAERHQLLIEWNATRTDYPKHKCIHQIFEEQAARTPDAVALVCEEQQLSYQALNEKANQLAHYLIKAGVKADDLVAICMDRSFDLVIGLLAILKSGGAYAPLDLTYPPSRLAFMLEDTKARVLLTHSALAEQLPAGSGQVVCLDKCLNDLKRESTENPGCNTSSNNLAYVIYTSGSTGIPKGVEVCHYNIARLVLNNAFARFDNKQNFLLLAPVAFDASTFEIWGGLLHGARCVIYPERVPTMSGLEKIIKQQHISIIWLTAALFNAVIDEKPQILATVAQILTGGEALSTSHIQRALKQLPDTQLINGYGPTESTTFACCYPIPKSIDPQVHSIPIGYPIANTQTYILDKHLQPVPIGVPGEILIGGDGLARGYLNRPELTAEKFIAHPFTDNAQARLYKTGDLARYLPDGAIEFLGRIDRQIKLRGFRIELGEIESVLGLYPGINEVVVTVREDHPGDKRLVAYLTHSEQEPPQVNELRLFLKEKLPEYMVPAAFVLLDKMPLTANGKLDRKALPVPDPSRPEFEQSYIPPRTANEERLATIWKEVLNIDQIGMHDNFFELGGHSLLAVSLLAQVNREFHTDLPLVTVFNFPTVAQMAELLSTQEASASFFSLFQIQKEGSKPPLFWIQHHADNGVIKHMGKDQPIYCLHHGIGAPPGSTITSLGVKHLAAHYIEELLMVKPEGPYYLIGHCWGGLVAFEMAQQLNERNKNVPLLIMVDTNVPNSAKSLPLRQQLTRIMSLSPYEFATKFFTKLKRTNSKVAKNIRGTTYRPEVFDRDLVDSVVKEYKPKAYSGRVILFTAKHRRSHLRFHVDPPELGWRKLVDGKLTVHEIPVGHNDIIHGESGKHIAHIVTEAINDVLNNPI